MQTKMYNMEQEDFFLIIAVIFYVKQFNLIL